MRALLLTALAATTRRCAGWTLETFSQDDKYPDVRVYLPDSYDENAVYPTILALHGYTMDGSFAEAVGLSYWTSSRLTDGVDEYGYIVVAPTGLTDDAGSTYWKATDACCGSCGWFGCADSSEAFLLATLEGARERYPAIDPARVHLFGYSSRGPLCHYVPIFI
jgi:poly(3-hydroxybutyrate) depolymerase